MSGTQEPTFCFFTQDDQNPHQFVITAYIPIKKKMMTRHTISFSYYKLLKN